MDHLQKAHFDPKRAVALEHATVDDAKMLSELGYCTVPVVKPSELAKLRKAMDWTIERFPEYNRNPSDPTKTSPMSFKDHLASHPVSNRPDPNGLSDYIRAKSKGNEGANSFRNKPIRYVQGGFSAFANPSSFHNDFVRQLRRLCYGKVIKLMEQYEGLQRHAPRNFEMIVDRMMLRTKGVAPNAEAPHRDETPMRGKYTKYRSETMVDCNDPDTYARFKEITERSGAAEGDDLFGGWLNLDNETQVFNCIPANFQKRKVFNKGSAGFARLKDLDKSQIQAIKVPPGHILVFFQNIAHEVRNKKASYNMYRLFTAFRLTKDSEPLFYDMNGMMSNLEVVPLKSLQVPPMYAKLHWSCHRNIIIPWSYSTIQPKFLIPVPNMGIKLHQKPVEGVDKKTIMIAPRILKGLRALCTDAEIARICSPYTNAERKMYLPHKLKVSRQQARMAQVQQHQAQERTASRFMSSSSQQYQSQTRTSSQSQSFQPRSSSSSSSKQQPPRKRAQRKKLIQILNEGMEEAKRMSEQLSKCKWKKLNG